MLATSKTLSLIEQKRLQWAKEKEEMVGLYGLWGRPIHMQKNESNQILPYNKNNLLPPIQGKNEFKEPLKEQDQREEESETSGYLSDSPKHLKEVSAIQECPYVKKISEQLNNEKDPEYIQQQYWNEVDKSENYWVEKKICKNYKNENWAHQNTEAFIRQNPRLYQSNKNFWYGTPESVSSDDGSRLRWGDRGVGIGHLWEPVINPPDCRLPQVADSCRQTPKWVEKGLKNGDGNKADILIIHHPDDEVYDQPQKNFLLGQNAPISPEEIEEREKKRRKALEHQNAIKKQLEERELKRKQERESRIKEERLEEERIKKEQEIEKFRYEEEQRKIKQKEEMEKQKEKAMREAIEIAEKRAKEEKKRNRMHLIDEANQKIFFKNEKMEKLEKIMEHTSLSNKKYVLSTPRQKKTDETLPEIEFWAKKEGNEKILKDSSSQFEDIQLAKNFQFLNVNGLPVDGGLALMLDNSLKDNNFLLPHDGVQLALLMSPKNASSTNQLISTPTQLSNLSNFFERTLTPSKYRIMERLRLNPSNKSTQTDFKFNSGCIKPVSAGKIRKQRRNGTNSGSSISSQKSNVFDRHNKHIRCFISSKHRSKPNLSKISLEDRPKWGINRPSVQYKKQSEKDPYYQKKIKERLKKVVESGICSDFLIKNEEKENDFEEKELDSVVRLLDCQFEEEKKPAKIKEDIILQNGYRMNSNLSSPVFVPIGNKQSSDWNKSMKSEIDSERSRSNDSLLEENEDINEEEEEIGKLGSIAFLTRTQLEAIKQITNLREGLKKLQKDYSNSRSITPFSEKNDFLTKKKEPAQVLDLSKVKITSKEEFKKYLDKIPECKVKPEKILAENIRVKDKDFSFIGGKREEKQIREWNYPDPTPPDMKGVKLEDLCPVNIDWKMLTTLRPKTKVEEDMFSRLVQLGKMHLKHQQVVQREKNTDWVRKTKNPKSSIIEMRVLSCKECGEDFCDGSVCSKLIYENFFRPQPITAGPSQNLLLAAETGETRKNTKSKKKRKKRFRKRSQSKGRRRKLGKNSIFNRPSSRGCSRDHSRTTKAVERSRPRALSSTRSFSTERKRASFFNERSKSAPRIHFECDILNSKTLRYEYASDSGPSQSDFYYSSQSDSDSPHFHQRFIASRLRLSGRRKLLSARVGFVKKNQRSSSKEGSKFVRKCTLYKDCHSDASIPYSHNDQSSSGSSTPSYSGSPFKSPERIFPRSSTSAKCPSTVQIQFDNCYSFPRVRFPEKIVFSSKTLPRRKIMQSLKYPELVKKTEAFSKIELEFNQEYGKKSQLLSPLKPKAGLSTHISRPKTSVLSKFSGPYLKAKGLFEKKSD